MAGMEGWRLGWGILNLSAMLIQVAKQEFIIPVLGLLGPF